MDLKENFAVNLSRYRKEAKLTQAELAEKLNYSDKAVSKWERGESVLDVITLVQLASQFDITVNDLLADPNALPDNLNTLEKAMAQVSEKTLKRKANKNIILALSSILVWFVALLVFVVLSSLSIPNSSLAFLYAVPVNAIVLLSLRSAWHDFRWNRILISVMMWGILACIHMTLLLFLRFNMWKLYLLGLPGQAAILLWFRLFQPVREKQPPAAQEEAQND